MAKTGAVGKPSEQFWHITSMLRRKGSLQTDQSWKAKTLQCETGSGFCNARWSLLLLVFCAAHRIVYKQKLCKMDIVDIVFRRLLRSIVGQHGDVDWNLPWHENPHH